MKVLVTGSSGQIGSYVCENLMRDHQVVGLDIRDQPYDSLKRFSVVGDIRDQGSVRNALKGVEAVVHCAAQVSVVKSTEDPLQDASTNVLGTVNMLTESVAAGVSKFIYISSAAVLGNPKYIPIDENHPTNPMSNYGVSKLAGEKYAYAFAKNTKMQVCSVRPFNCYSSRSDPDSPYSGVITRFFSRLRSGQPPIIEGDGGQIRDFIHSKDVAYMVELLVSKRWSSGETYNCGTGVSTSILELANAAIAASGKNLKPEFTSPRVGDIRQSLADTSRSAGLIGFRARIKLADGLREMFG